VFHAAPDVTLEADLARRDLTINAMARDDAGELIDFHDGGGDQARRVLRHVSPAFAEDPLRVLRVARFAARFGFAVADETQAMMRGSGRTRRSARPVAERVWQEVSRGSVRTASVADALGPAQLRRPRLKLHRA
jgi:tRNA nucleotidyltransferase (CCA-adding enzyme)